MPVKVKVAVSPLRDETVRVLPEAPGSLRCTHEPWYEMAESRSSTTCWRLAEPSESRSSEVVKVVSVVALESPNRKPMKRGPVAPVVRWYAWTGEPLSRFGGTYRIGGCQPWQGALEVTDLLLHREFVGEGAFFVESGAVVVGGKAGRRGPCPSPVRPALEHVVVECCDAITNGGDAPLSGECGIGEFGAGAGGERGTPWGEGPALGLSDELWGGGSYGPELGFVVAQGIALSVAREA